MTAWKATEREVARHLGGKRVPITGRQRGDVPDVAHDVYSLEIKHRKVIPAWIENAMAQARAAARPGQLPLAIIHQHGRRHADNLVVLRMSDFIEWYGDLPDEETGSGDA